MNNKKKIIAGFLCLALGGTTLIGGYDKAYAKNIGASIQNTEVTDIAPGDQTRSIDATEIKDENILNSTYYAYGDGCIFVTVNKDSASGEGAEEDTDLDNVDNLEEMDSTAEPSETPAEETEENNTATMANTGIVSSKSLIDACLTDEEKALITSGQNQELRVTFHNATDGEMKKNEISALGEAMDEYETDMPGMYFANYVQVTFAKKDLATGKWRTIKKLLNPVEINLDIMSDYQVAGSSYYLVQLGEKKQKLLEDKDEYLETITCSVEGSYSYGLCYLDNNADEVEETPIPTVKPTFWGRLVSDDLCLWHCFVLAMLIIGLTWVAAINNVKIRTIFLVIMSVICVALAIMGSCSWDWPIAIVSIVLMILLHVLRVLKNRK